MVKKMEYENELLDADLDKGFKEINKWEMDALIKKGYDHTTRSY